MANFEGNKSTDINSGNAEGSGLSEYVKTQLDPSINWEDIKWLRNITKLPVVVKGIMTAEDAVLCAEAGIDAVVVSNHGARQVDGTAATVNIIRYNILNINCRYKVQQDLVLIGMQYSCYLNFIFSKKLSKLNLVSILRKEQNKKVTFIK